MGDFDLKSRITNFTDLSSYCETTLELKSRIETDFYGELQETTLPFKVVKETPAPLPNMQIRPIKVSTMP